MNQFTKGTCLGGETVCWCVFQSLLNKSSFVLIPKQGTSPKTGDCRSSFLQMQTIQQIQTIYFIDLFLLRVWGGRIFGLSRRMPCKLCGFGGVLQWSRLSPYICFDPLSTLKGSNWSAVWPFDTLLCIGNQKQYFYDAFSCSAGLEQDVSASPWKWSFGWLGDHRMWGEDTVKICMEFPTNWLHVS